MDACSLSQENTIPVMETSIWSQTPDHIIELILAFLPVEDLVRMRTVHKAWKSDILTVMFRRLHRELSPRQQPWFLVSTTKRSFSAYDPNTQKWNILSAPRLPDPDLKVLASSHGLVCYGFSSGEDVTFTDFYICNPITGEWRQLPQHPEKTVDHFGMKYDDKTNSYKILTMKVASTGGMIQRVTIYDSRLGQWTEGPVPRNTSHFSKAPMVWCGNCVYFMDRIRPFCELHAYNVEQSTWHELRTASPQFFEFPLLVACKERLFIVGLCSDSRKIWEVVMERQSDRLEFVEYDTLPAMLPNEFGVKKKLSFGFGRCANYNSFRLNAVGSSGQLMCFSSNLDHTWVLIYDTERKTFHESPKDKHPLQLSDNVVLSFQPCLDASP